MTDKERIERLEKRVSRLEDKLANMPDGLPRTKPVVKSWREIFEWTLAHDDDVTWRDDGGFDHAETGAIWERTMWDTCGKEVELIDDYPYQFRLIDGEFTYLSGWVKYD